MATNSFKDKVIKALTGGHANYILTCAELIEHLGGSIPTAMELMSIPDDMQTPTSFQSLLGMEIVDLLPEYDVEVCITKDSSELFIQGDLITCLDDYLGVRDSIVNPDRDDCPQCGGDGCADCEDSDNHFYPYGEDFYE